MKTKKIPMRTCVVTHEKCEKKDLLRVVRNNEGEVFVDDTLKANGRGAYLKKDKDIIEKARKSKILEKHLETNIKEEIYDELLTKIQ
ncbi:MAG: YlxR family protein [Bacilli bacterium]|nr:YlxR family protein [Bacilli bacterium]